MKKSYIGEETIEVFDDPHVELKYYILKNEKESDFCKFIEYGIEIEKKDKSGIERSRVTDITTDQTRIDFIVKSLMKHNVTPIHLRDVIVDML